MIRSLLWRMMMCCLLVTLCPAPDVAYAAVTTVKDYDSDGNLIRVTEAADSEMERVTEYAYTDGNLTTITKYLDDGSTLITEMQYDADGNLIWQRDPSGRETLYTYKKGKVNTVHTDQGVWRYEYDLEGRLHSITDPFGDVRERNYDDDGNVSNVLVNGEVVATYTYEGGKLIQQTDAGGNVYTFAYNADGQLSRQEDPEGAFVEYEYDEGRLWKTRDGNGNEIVREYELVGTSGSCQTCTPLLGGAGGGYERLTRIIYPTFTKEFLYDDKGRVSEEIYHLSDTESYSVTFAYDAFGRLESTTGPDHETTTYGYDLLGRRTSITDSSGTTRLEYDLWDNLIALIDAKNQRSEFEYYPDGTLKLERRPMDEETSYEYYPAGSGQDTGRLWKILDAKNQLTEYGYDNQGRIETIAYADGKTVTLAYDDNGNLSDYTDGETSAEYDYDDMGRKTWERVNYGPFSKEYAYTYYGNGLKQTFTAPDGIVYTYNYGDNNELREVQIPGVGSITIPNYSWNRPATINYPGGMQRSYTYDALMRLQSLTVTDPGSNSILDYSYTYDNVSNIETKNTEHGNYAYGYDNVSRLLTADNPVLADEAYTYDGVGNRLTSVNVDGTWSYNQNNELESYGNISYVYDENGNMTQQLVDGTVVRTFLYNAKNRLVKIEDENNQTIVEYSYDPFGRRLWKDIGGTKTYFFYSEEGLIGEYDETGTELRTYGYKPDFTWMADPLFLKQGTNYYFYQNDHLGTPQKLVSINGTVVWTAQYSAFGEAESDISIVTNNLRFSGQYEDAETGLYYNWFRYYDPKVGRYLRKDPIGLRGGSNLYPYVSNNPMSFVDSFGLIKVGIAIPNGLGNTAAEEISQNNTFDFIASQSADKGRWKRIYTGQEILRYLAEQSADADCPIELLTIAGHGWSFQNVGCFGGPGIPGAPLLFDIGLYSDQVFGLLKFRFKERDAATVSELQKKIERGEITFAENCTIQIYGCRISHVFARELAKATTCRVVAGSRSCHQRKKPNEKQWQSDRKYTDEHTCPLPEFYEIIPCAAGGSLKMPVGRTIYDRRGDPMGMVYAPCTSVPCLSPNIEEGVVPCQNVKDDITFVN